MTTTDRANLTIPPAAVAALHEAGDEPMNEYVRAIAAPVVAAELRRMAADLRSTALELNREGMLSASEQNVYARNIRALRDRADELDPS